MNNKQWEKDCEKVAKYYADKIEAKGYTFEALAVRDKKYTNMFFDEMFAGLNVKACSSFMDIGSGLGLFIEYIKERKWQPKNYMGVDLIEQFVDYSKQTYKGFTFLHENFISESFALSSKYDYVFALGVLVSRVSDYKNYLSKFIKKMVSYSKKYVLFNLITQIDNNSANYSNKYEIGGITYIERFEIEKILNSIPNITYKIIEKKIFDDATDAFVQIEII